MSLVGKTILVSFLSSFFFFFGYYIMEVSMYILGFFFFFSVLFFFLGYIVEVSRYILGFVFSFFFFLGVVWEPLMLSNGLEFILIP
jgi:hypothetical protein